MTLAARTSSIMQTFIMTLLAITVYLGYRELSNHYDLSPLYGGHKIHSHLTHSHGHSHHHGHAHSNSPLHLLQDL
jgi:hypothetical protein